jgi:hypothetical protein
MTAPHRKHWAIARKSPMIMPGYPHPECITGGWTALLNEVQTEIVTAKIIAMQRIDRGYYFSYTGFDALDAETQADIRKKLNENKQWEKINGPVWFHTPDPHSPKLKIMPDTTDKKQTTEWRGQLTADVLRWLSSRRRQVKRMVVDDGYPVRTYIYRA